jgi:hypothetical protein
LSCWICLLVGGDGLQLARQLALEAKVPVIVTSDDIEKAEQAAEAAFTCLLKTVSALGLGRGSLKTFGGRPRRGVQ